MDCPISVQELHGFKSLLLADACRLAAVKQLGNSRKLYNSQIFRKCSFDAICAFGNSMSHFAKAKTEGAKRTKEAAVFLSQLTTYVTFLESGRDTSNVLSGELMERFETELFSSSGFNLTEDLERAQLEEAGAGGIHESMIGEDDNDNEEDDDDHIQDRDEHVIGGQTAGVHRQYSLHRTVSQMTNARKFHLRNSVAGMEIIKHIPFIPKPRSVILTRVQEMHQMACAKGSGSHGLNHDASMRLGIPMASESKSRQMRRFTQGGSVVGKAPASADLRIAVAQGRAKNISSGGIMWSEQIVNGEIKYFERTDVQEGNGGNTLLSPDSSLSSSRGKNLLGTKRPQKTLCTLCRRYYTKKNLPFVVSMSTVLRLKRKWGAQEDAKRQAVGSFMYSETRLCTFCGQFFDSEQKDGHAQTSCGSRLPMKNDAADVVSKDGAQNVAYRAKTHQSSTAKGGESLRAVAIDAGECDDPSKGRWTSTQTQVEPCWDAHFASPTEVQSMSFYYEFVPSNMKQFVKTKVWILVADEPFLDYDLSAAKAQAKYKECKVVQGASGAPRKMVFTLSMIQGTSRVVRIAFEGKGALKLCLVAVHGFPLEIDGDDDDDEELGSIFLSEVSLSFRTCARGGTQRRTRARPNAFLYSTRLCSDSHVDLTSRQL